MIVDELFGASTDQLKKRRVEFVIARRELDLRIREVKKTAAQRIKDLEVVKGSLQKRLISIVKLERNSDIKLLDDRREEILRLILVIDRIINER